MYLRKLNNKAAIELSIGTIVIIVIAMSMLIMGLVLVRTIFTGATDSVNDLNEKVRESISGLFTDQNEDVVVKLGPEQKAKIEPNSGVFGVAIGARTLDGNEVEGFNHLRYRLTLESPTGNNCVSPSKLGQRKTEDLFITPLNKYNNFDRFTGANVYAIVEVKVPKGTELCSQKVLIEVQDTKDNNNIIGGNFFRIEIIRDKFIGIF